MSHTNNPFGEPPQTRRFTSPQTHGKVRFCPPGKNPLTCTQLTRGACCLGLPIGFIPFVRYRLHKASLTLRSLNVLAPQKQKDRPVSMTAYPMRICEGIFCIAMQKTSEFLGGSPPVVLPQPMYKNPLFTIVWTKRDPLFDKNVRKADLIPNTERSKSLPPPFTFS